MAKKVKNIDTKISKCNIGSKCGGCGGCGYILGFLGALIYNMTVATSFGGVIIGILKSLIWPAFLVFELFKFLGM